MIAAVDLTNRIHVHWYAHRDVDRALVALRNELKAIAWRLDPKQAFAACDPRGPTFRHAIDPSYKAGRSAKEEGLQFCLFDGPAVAQQAGWTPIVVDGFEADDVLATIAERAAFDGDKCVLVSPDKDLLGCLRAGSVSVLRRWKCDGRTLGDLDVMTAVRLNAEYGFGPQAWVDFQCVVGDASDGVVGWEGVGEATAMKWLARHTLVEILGNRWCVSMNAKQQRGMATFVARLPTLRRLLTLRTDVPIAVAEESRS